MEAKLDKKKISKDDILNEILYVFKTIVITSVLIFMIFNFLFTPVTVEGPSMTPTLLDKQWGFSSLIGKFLGNYNRFDVVVVNYEQKDVQLVKRIIGLPGETIEYCDDKLYINGKYVKENYFDKKYVDTQTYNGAILFTDDFGPITLKKNEYFVMGDNRPRSTDSRVLGAFKKEDILSKSLLVLLPISNIHYAGNGK